jgi:hypothetical protein
VVWVSPHRQGDQQLDVVADQAEFLVGLPQGGGGQVGVAWIALAAGQGELAAVAAILGRRTSTNISWPSRRRYTGTSTAASRLMVRR